MQVQNDTDEDLDFELEGGRPEDPFKGSVTAKAQTPIPPEIMPIRKARITGRGGREVFWEQEFRDAHSLVFRDAIVQSEPEPEE